MKPPIHYIKDFMGDVDHSMTMIFNELMDLEWEKRGNTPRFEYYTNDFDVPYVYGRGRGIREYLPKPKCAFILLLGLCITDYTGHHLEVCFLNRYDDLKDHLGWHSDDSPEMDDKRPICIYSVGDAREIWFRPKGDKNPENVYKLLMEPGSLVVMEPGMQIEWEHRIPKCDRKCGVRISLTYRGYISPEPENEDA
ncbi:MAG: alpha-ketoglutarate-dependent dioxygenase AlkB [Nitrosopumilaceae archaeon]|nr:alpha-ketoglutarate-dependent dioxygenase AlkB [Nitrosopumilaceae archaeon]